MCECDGVVNVCKGLGVGESDVVVDFDTATLVEIVFVRDAAVPEFVIWELQCGTLPIGMKTADNGTAALLLMVPDKRSPNSPVSSLQYCVIPCAAAAAAVIVVAMISVRTYWSYSRISRTSTTSPAMVHG
jgi:hypothetical protein